MLKRVSASGAASPGIRGLGIGSGSGEIEDCIDILGGVVTGGLDVDCGFRGGEYGGGGS